MIREHRMPILELAQTSEEIEGNDPIENMIKLFQGDLNLGILATYRSETTSVE